MTSNQPPGDRMLRERGYASPLCLPVCEIEQVRVAMNRTSTKTLIRRYVLENFLYTDDEDLLEDDVSFLENGVVDSTGVLELVMFVEDTFGIPVKDEEIVPENFDSVDRLAQYVESQAGKTAFIAS